MPPLPDPVPPDYEGSSPIYSGQCEFSWDKTEEGRILLKMVSHAMTSMRFYCVERDNVDHCWPCGVYYQRWWPQMAGDLDDPTLVVYPGAKFREPKGVIGGRYPPALRAPDNACD